MIDHPMNCETFATHAKTQRSSPAQGRRDHPRQSRQPQEQKRKVTLRQRGGWFLFLPPYSSDLNPPERAFAKPALSEPQGL
jgi:hypothetical protein